MEQILIFEDNKTERDDIKSLVEKVLVAHHSKMTLSDYVTIRDFESIPSIKGDTLQVIITDVLNSEKELVEYNKILEQARGSDESQKKALIEEANKVLIEASKESFIFIAKAWKKANCPIIILTKINRSNLVRIFEGLRDDNDSDFKEMFCNDIDSLISKIKRKGRIMYRSKNVFLFLKKEYYGIEDDTSSNNREAHNEFNNWFAKKMVKILKFSKSEQS